MEQQHGLEELGPGQQQHEELGQQHKQQAAAAGSSATLETGAVVRLKASMLAVSWLEASMLQVRHGTAWQRLEAGLGWHVR